MAGAQEELTRWLDEIDAEDDTPEEVYDQIQRNIEATTVLPPTTPDTPAIPTPGAEASETTAPTKGEAPQLQEWPYRDVDPYTGRIRPISPEELRARYEEYERRLAEIDAADDTPEEVYDQFMRNIDEERRRQGRPPAFEGCY